MNKLLLIPVLLTIIPLAGCQSAKNDITPPHAVTQEKPTPPSKDFPEGTLLALLTGEFAEYRQDFRLALASYVDQAIKTKDPLVTERAYHIAYYLNSHPEQLEMARLWVSLAPNNIDANRAAALQLTQNEQVNKAISYYEKVLASTKQLDFLNIINSNLTKKTYQEVIDNLNKLLVTHSNNMPLIYSKAVLLAKIGENESALTTLQALNTDKQPAISLLKAYLLQNTGHVNEALALLAESIKENPKDKELRLTYAHQLITQNKLVEAKQQFTTLINQHPDDEELRFGYALICIEKKDWNEAINYLKQIIDSGISSDAVYYYLATAYNEKGDKEAALENYAYITAGENHLAAITSMAKILFEKHQIKQARQLLSKMRAQHPAFAIPLYSFETETLININQTTQAWLVINQALGKYPNQAILLYSRAFVAEKRNNIQQAEKDLRQVIRQEPNNASAMNALGYILADRTNRYQEALALIQQAITLEPTNPATLDSLGWINYKLGQLDEAVKYLRLAYSHYPDPEVAAHLGEVLWKMGQQQEAKTIWVKSLDAYPNNQVIQETIYRLTGNKDL